MLPLLLPLLLSVASVARSAAVGYSNSSIDGYIAFESPLAYQGVLDNIGLANSSSNWTQGALPGIVIASPSTVNPDYLFTWTRDTSLTLQLLVDRYTTGEAQYAGLRAQIEAWIGSTRALQQVSNPSGSPERDYTNLGEPKFYINQTQFTGSWGRPQRDGPALRATALITYANYLKASQPDYVKEQLWPLVALDLDYTVQWWNETSYDLWEEVSGASFFTSMAQYRGLSQGGAFAYELGAYDQAGRYWEQARNVLCFIQTYWNGKYIDANVNVINNARTGLDVNPSIASIHLFDAEAGCDDVTFQPCSPKALASVKLFVDSFRNATVAPINANISAGKAVALGRYAEDVYYSGNPWYLTTFAVAEQLYDAVYVWTAQKQLEITATSLAFFKELVPSAAVGTYYKGDSQYTTLVNAVKAYGDGFVAINQKYTPPNGTLSEQFNKTTGEPLSAYRLTWSFASALSTFDRRAGIIPKSWNAGSVPILASDDGTCYSNQVARVPMKFSVYNVPALVNDEEVTVTGFPAELQTWQPLLSPRLNSTGNNTYSVSVQLPIWASFEFKFLVRSPSSKNVTYQLGENNRVQLGGPGSNNALSMDWNRTDAVAVVFYNATLA